MCGVQLKGMKIITDWREVVHVLRRGLYVRVKG